MEVCGSKLHGISLSVPAPLTAAEPPSSSVVCTYYGPDSSYPSFNIVIVPERDNPLTQPLGELLTKIQDDYRLVGISDADWNDMHRDSVAGQSVAVVEVTYSLGGRMLRSWVGVIPGRERYFIVTYTDLVERYEERSRIREEIVGSMRLVEGPEVAERGEALLRDEYWWWVVVVLGVGIGVVVVILRRCRGRNF